VHNCIELLLELELLELIISCTRRKVSASLAFISTALRFTRRPAARAAGKAGCGG
jgi:hypothetical protein